MGLHDRSYARDDSYRGGGSGLGGGLRMGPVSGWSITMWLIVINASVFLIGILLAGRSGAAPLTEWGHFSTYTLIEQKEIWRLLTFQFLHGGFWHLFMNMLALYWFGPQVEQHLGSRRYLAFYLLCGGAGAITYMLLNLGGYFFGNLPLLLIDDPHVPLVGASAGVFGVLLAGAYLFPHRVITLLLFFVLPVSMKMRTLAYGLVVLALITVYQGKTGSNAGGEAAHLGGAILGAFLIRHVSLLNWSLGPKGRGGGAPSRPSFFPDRASRTKKKDEASEKEIDRILAKVGTQGLHSLTDKEKRTLESDTKRRRTG